MKRSFKLLLCIIAIVALMVGCELPAGSSDTHGHEFVDANSDGICDTCNTDGTATHGHAFVDANGDNVCDTCNNDGAATHGHAFVDSNNDNVCDTCAAAAHVHTYASEWSYNATKHWHAGSCGHSSLKKDEASHSLDAFGVCTVCENQIAEPDLSTIDKALAIAEAMKGLVENGKMTDNDEYSYNEVIEYLFANGYFYTKVTNDYFGAETWYSTDANGAIFAIERNTDGEVRRLSAYDNISLDNLGGYMFKNPFVEDSFFYGLEEFIAGLWEIGKDDWNGDLVSSIEDGVFAFSYGYYFDDILFVVDVAFELSDEYYIDSAEVSIVAYYEYNVIPGATDEDEPTYEIADEATAYGRMNYSFEQNVEAENPYPADEILANSFKVVDANGVEIGTVLNVEKGTNLYLYLADVLPETAILDFIQVSAIGEAADNFDVYIRASEDENGNWAIVITGYSVGSFDVKLTVNGVEKDVTINVAAAVPTEVEVSVYEEIEEVDWFGNHYKILSPFAADSSYTVWVGTAPIILSGAANKGDITDCVVTVNGTLATLVEKETTEGWVYVLVFEPDEAGVYEIEFTAVADETISETVTVTVKAPDTEEILSGKYVYTEDGVNIWEVVFSGWSDSITVNYREYNAVSKTWKLYSAEYNYAWENNQLKTTFARGYYFAEAVTINAETDFEVVIDGNVLVKETAEAAFVGEWSYKIYNEYWTEVIDEYVLIFNADGTGVFEAEGVKYYFTYTVGEYDVENENYPITIVADETAENVGTTTAFGAGATVFYSYDPSYTTLYVNNGEIEADEWDEWEISYTYSKASVETEEYKWPEEITPLYPVYVCDSTDKAGQIELLLNALPGKYVIYVCYFGETTPITALNEYSFVVGGVNVVGALIFEVDEAQRIIITMNVPASYDYQIYVEYTEAETDDDEGEDEINGAFEGTYVAIDNWGNEINVLITDTTISFTPVGPGAMEIVWTYERNGDVVTLYDVNGDEITNPLAGYVEATNGLATAFGWNGNNYNLEKKANWGTSGNGDSGDSGDNGSDSGDDSNEATGLEGVYSFVDAWNNVVEVTIDSTTISFIPVMASEAIVYGYTYDGTVAAYTNSLGVPVTMIYQFSLVFDAGEIVGMWYNGNEYTISDGNGGESGEAEATGLEGVYTMVDDWENEVVVTIDETTISFIPVGSTDGEAIVYGYTYDGIFADYTNSLGVPVTMPNQFSLVIDAGEIVGMWYNGNTYEVV